MVVLACLLIFSPAVLCQQPAASKYPNELKGFKLIDDKRLQNLMPGITTAKEVMEAENFLEDDKKNDCERCLYNEDWNVYLLQINSSEGNLFTIQFYPRKRISFSKVKFPKQFTKGGMGIAHGEVEKCLIYEDIYGLRYVIVDEKGNEKYKKGDLYYIEYGAPENRNNP